MSDMRRFLPLAATIVVIAVNAAANIVPLNGYQTGQLSDLNPTGFTPAGWVFSIWSLIYLGLLAYSFTAAWGSQATRQRAARVTGPYLLNAAANAAWILAWHWRQVALSFAIMLVILGTLIAIFLRLRALPRPTLRERLVVDAPFSLYFGWITTATIANLGALLYVVGRYPLGLAMDEWAVASVGLALAIYAWMGAVTRDSVYSAVFVWAALGIALKPAGVTAPVRVLAGTGVVALIAILLWIAWQRRSQSSTARA